MNFAICKYNSEGTRNKAQDTRCKAQGTRKAEGTRHKKQERFKVQGIRKKSQVKILIAKNLLFANHRVSFT
jgi:hypothetical protein